MLFLFFIMLSIALMFFDYHNRYLAYVRHAFSVLVSPVQYLVDYPVRVVGSMQSMLTTKSQLIQENMQLHHEQLMLEAQLQKFLVLKEENSELKALLHTTRASNVKAMAAEILAVDTSTSRQILILNKGKKDTVYVGQPVLDAAGVMGQIVDVGWMTSSVLLISDSKCAVPVRNYRTGERAILVGTNKLDQLSLINLPKTASVLPGDLLVTSGLGRRYPEGYPVGRVKKVRHIAGEAFVTVDVEPEALLNRNRLALLIWPEKAEYALNHEITERLKSWEAGK